MAFDERSMNGMGVFVAIVDTGSFAAAGEVLDMSQPGVSRSIARLEARLGVRLFDRTTRTVTLTDDGRRFHGLVTPLLAGLEEAADSTSRGAAVVRGRLRVNVDQASARLLSGLPITDFLRSHPELQLEIVTCARPGDLVGEGFDLALRFGESNAAHLVVRKLLETRLITVAAPVYLAANGRPSEPEALTEHLCIQLRDPPVGRAGYWQFQRGQQRIEVATQGALTVTDAGLLREFCQAGTGIAQLLLLGNEEALETQSLVELFPEWADEPVALFAWYPARQTLPAKTRALLDFVSAQQG